MSDNNRKYIYLNNITVKGAAFQTQVLDWLHLYKKHKLEFELIHIFDLKDLFAVGDFRKQVGFLKKSSELYRGFLVFLPSRRVLYILNALAIYFKILKHLRNNDELVIFSRGIIGKEMSLLQKRFSKKIIFFYDARGAGAEENKYSAAKDKNFSLKRYRMIADTYYLEYKSIAVADRVFVVSNVLKKYFQDTYGMKDKKFVLYPCLSDSGKFFLNHELRKATRDRLNISGDTKVFIYSGGVGAWHMADGLFYFFIRLLEFDNNSKMLFLTKDTAGIEKTISGFPELKNRYMVFSVPNSEVNDYLNAADYGILFRENTIMNNVASPTKFAEYILSGLPVLISEGIGDFSEFTVHNDIGVLIRESILNNPDLFDFNGLLTKQFDRARIAEIGLKSFSKDSAIGGILSAIKS